MNTYVQRMCDLKVAYKYEKKENTYICMLDGENVSADSTYTSELFKLFDKIGPNSRLNGYVGGDLHHIHRVGNSYIGYILDSDSNSFLAEAISSAMKNGEFDLYYQPQVNIAHNKVVGAEALIRWNHPVLGFVSPAHFIPVAERTGQIVDLGKWVMERACREYSSWSKQMKKNVRMSVNVSVKQLEDDSFLSFAKDVFESHRIDPTNFIVELTETTGPADLEGLMNILSKIHQTGVGIAIDDFGIGYSALHYLQKLPIDQIKMDRSFVSTIHTKEGYTIVKFLVDLATDLGHNIVAEGVETQQQVEILRDIDCHEVQGFFYSPAIPAPNFISYASSM